MRHDSIEDRIYTIGIWIIGGTCTAYFGAHLLAYLVAG